MSSDAIKKIEKIVDFSNLRQAPEKSPMHWGYVIFFGIAMVAALWQHGQPLLSLLLFLLLFPAGAMASLPYKYFSSEKRFYLQILLAIAAGGWFLFRKQHHVPVDKAMIESCCIVGLCLLFAQRSSDYNYLLMISIFLLLYGALLPRNIFMVTFIIAVALGTLLLYSSRINSFAGQPEPLKNPRRSTLAALSMIVLHIIIAAGLFGAVFSLLPSQSGGHRGLFEVSFSTNNESMVPPEFRSWFPFNKLKLGKKGPLINRGKKPTTLGHKGVAVKLKKGTYMSSDGNGAGPPGKALVFRVKSPVKLYWLAQLYDRYNGQIWRQSKYLKNCTNIRFSRAMLRKVSNLLEQQFIIEKWLTPKLFSAYRANYFDVTEINSKVKAKATFYNAELTGKRYPPLPFAYRVTSVLYLPNAKQNAKDTFWHEKVKKSFYLQLPRKKISKRLRQLVKRLTADKNSPMQKAIALRDYLRGHFKYKQFSKRVPPQREAVDYFIFDLKEGHCEYFASALAVMARLSGLPARIATGFSPGNYNLLTGYFEVHQYHAHAWTQIYIPNCGWLTFDATPPGNIVSRTTPFGFGSFKDPFGDKWRIMPPELTKNTLKFIANGYLANLTPDSLSKYNAAERALIKTSMAPEMVEQQLNEFMNKMFPKMKGDGLDKITLWYKQIKEEIDQMMGTVMESLRLTAQFIVDHLVLSLAVLAFTIAMGLAATILYYRIKRHRILKKCRDYYQIAEENVDKNPDKTVAMCYLLTRQLLILVGLSRQNNAELLDYAKSLHAVHPRLSVDALRIFYSFIKLEYGRRSATTAEAELVLQRTENVKSILYPVIDKYRYLTLEQDDSAQTEKQRSKAE